MKKIKCLIGVSDRYTGRQYKVGEVYEFEDARADEILACRTRVTKEPFFEEVVEEVETQDANNEENASNSEEEASVHVTEGENVEDVENNVENIDEVEHVVLEDMKVAELKELAEKMNIEGFNSMKKDELIEAIKNHG